jgi:fused signal recognition particle receptor
MDVDLSQALKKTEENFFGRIRSLFSTSGESTALEDIEEVLYTSDLGPKTVESLMEMMEDKLGRKELRDSDSVRAALKSKLFEIFQTAGPLEADKEKPMAQLARAASGVTVYMVVGVNGAGKTTSIGKMAARLAGEGQKVLVAAGDTFRAAAGAQLKVWTDRAQVDIFHPEGITDPGAVAFDAVAKAQAQGYNTVIIDTAGRLHTQVNLMAELEKVKRVMKKQIPDAPHETLIVLDANSGQNALMQAKEFHKAVGLTGAILTKMDGTAKGGVAVGLVNELGIPVKMIGVGERLRDLRPFSPKEFVDSILGTS